MEHISLPIKRLRKRGFKLTAPKPYVPKEYEEQEQVFLWAHGRPAQRLRNGHWLPAIPAQCSDPRIKLLFCTLNGVRLPIGLARKMKRAGNNPGVPDIILPVQAYGFSGLFIELKRKDGKARLSDDQVWWNVKLREQGFNVALCYGAAEAIYQLKLYLDIKE